MAALLAATSLSQCARADLNAEPTQRSQDRAPAALIAQFPDARIQRNPETGEVVRLSTLALKKPISEGTPDKVARAILSTPAVSSLLGLSEDLRELCASTVAPNPQIADYYSVRMAQCSNGTPVLGAEVLLNVRLGAQPTVDSLISSLVRIPPVSGTPSIDASRADRIATDAFAALRAGTTPPRSPQDPAPPAESPRLVVFPPSRFGMDGPSRLSWLVRKPGVEFVVDAEDGRILYRAATVYR